MKCSLPKFQYTSPLGHQIFAQSWALDSPPKNPIVLIHQVCKLNGGHVTQWWVVGVDFIFELFYAYLKQYKVHFNQSFQHLKFVIQLFKTILVDCFTQFPPYNYCSFYTNFISFFLINQWSKFKQIIKKPKHNIYIIKSMFLHQIHTSLFAQN